MILTLGNGGHFKGRKHAFLHFFLFRAQTILQITTIFFIIIIIMCVCMPVFIRMHVYTCSCMLHTRILCTCMHIDPFDIKLLNCIIGHCGQKIKQNMLIHPSRKSIHTCIYAHACAINHERIKGFHYYSIAWLKISLLRQKSLVSSNCNWSVTNFVTPKTQTYFLDCYAFIFFIKLGCC